MRAAAIVLAAGSGARFGEPKQFLALTDTDRLVDAAVRRMAAAVDFTVVVLPPDTPWDGSAVDAVVVGGASRLDSVANAVAVLPGDITMVVLSDAAHPLATTETARAAMAAVDAGADAAVPWLEAVDVLKRRDAKGRLTTLGREGIGAAQVPIACRRDLLDQAHRRRRAGDLAVDAVEDTQLIEALGGRVTAIPGDPANIHVVDRASLDLVRRLAAGHPS